MADALKLLIITGPTATGKSSLALELAQKYNGEIISADSRQIYEGMDIGTGKNLPKNAVRRNSQLTYNNQRLVVYEVDGILIWGYDIVGPLTPFSVADYVLFFKSVIREITAKGKLPILVGGTNFYVQSIMYPPETLFIPINESLREELELLSVEELQTRLQELNSQKLIEMNNSDRNNPRRLIRAIEVATTQSEKQIPPQLPKLDIQAFGLFAPKNVLEKNISENVLKRATDSFTVEVQSLNKMSGFWQSQAASATGYKIWNEFLKGNISKETAIRLWTTEELQYAKRQLVWLKKQPLELVDITTPHFQLHIEEHINAW